MAPPSAKPGRPQVKRKEMGKRTVEVPQYAVQEVVPIEPTRTALLVIDMQNDFVHQGGSLVVPDAEQTIPSIVALLELARAHAIRVAYSQDTHREGDPEWRICPEHCREKSWGWAIVQELAPTADDTVREQLRAIHRRQRSAPLVRRRNPARRSLSPRAIRPRVVPASDGVRVRGTDHHRRRCTHRRPEAVGTTTGSPMRSESVRIRGSRRVGPR
jgi:hypothetical protein